jgi:hypothetical protein
MRDKSSPPATNYEFEPLCADTVTGKQDSMFTPDRCECGNPLPFDPTRHVYRCDCGRLWLRPDCSEECAPWSEYRVVG